MDNNQAIEIFEKAPVTKAIFKGAVPAIITMVMNLVYNLADVFFISQTHNDYMIAAVSLATPVFLLCLSLGNMFGIGGTSVIARALGQQKQEYAVHVSAFCMWACVVTGIVISACMIIFVNPILSLIGASSDTWEYTKTYLVIVSLSGPFSVLNNCFTHLIRSDGHPKAAMMGQVMGNVINVVLDPLFILVFKWDIVGAAVATVAGNLLASAIYIGFFFSGKSILSIKLKDFSMKDNICRNVLAIGIPAALGSFLMSVSNIIANAQMASFGDMAVAGFGIAAKLVMITRLLSIGLGGGVQPLLGFCVGAKLKKRYNDALRYSLVFSFILSGSTTLLCYIFTKPIVNTFLTNAEAFDYGVLISRILISTSFVEGLSTVITNAIQAAGCGKEALVVNLSKQGIIYIPLMFILKYFFGMLGLLWAQPVTDLMAIVLTLIMYASARRKIQW